MVEITWKWSRSTMAWRAEHNGGVMIAQSVARGLGRGGPRRWTAIVEFRGKRTEGETFNYVSYAEAAAILMLERLFAEDRKTNG